MEENKIPREFWIALGFEYVPSIGGKKYWYWKHRYFAEDFSPSGGIYINGGTLQFNTESENCPKTSAELTLTLIGLMSEYGRYSGKIELQQSIQSLLGLNK